VWSTYNVTATLAGPRLSANPATSRTRGPPGVNTSMVSPTTTFLLDLDVSPLIATCPPVQASDAIERVLNIRAAHNHLSTRTFSMAFRHNWLKHGNQLA